MSTKCITTLSHAVLVTVLLESIDQSDMCYSGTFLSGHPKIMNSLFIAIIYLSFQIKIQQ